MTGFWCEHAWLPDGPSRSVTVECDDGGTIRAVRAGPPAAGAVRLAGLVTAGFANVHSHAFHRALRGRTHDGRGSFWTWRERMYELAGRLDPDSYHRLARAVYAEMALAGVTAAGEFHYVHHRPDGRRYAPPTAMADALRSAARDAGIRLTLIDACYLSGGIGSPLGPGQRRFSDGDAHAWAERVAAEPDEPSARLGVAVHSVRSVPPEAIRTVVATARGRGLPLHAHLSEQPAENAACLAAYGLSPTGLLDRHGALGPDTTVVHATHLADADIVLLGERRVHACLCPTTERDLADGIGPARRLADAGASVCLGTDQHALIDPLEEARGLEMDERLATGERGRFPPGELVDALTWRGHAALGYPAGGRIVPGAPCDLVAVSTSTVRTAGAEIGQVLLAATAADVREVVAGGRLVVRDGVHAAVADPAAELAAAVRGLTG